MKKSYSNRDFQLWEYRVSHGLLLLRAPKHGELSSNVDVVFAGVRYLAVPSYLQSLELEDPSREEVESLRTLLGEALSADEVTVLKSGGRRHFVVAAGVQVSENYMEIFDSVFDSILHDQRDRK